MSTGDGRMFGQSPGTPARSGVDEVHILWTSEGMSCDGDSVSITAAMQPSLEDVVLGLLPGLPKVHLHNKVLAYSLGGDDFMRPFHQAANGQLDHPSRIFLVDKKGRIREIYHLDFLKAPWVVEDIELLLNEMD